MQYTAENPVLLLVYNRPRMAGRVFDAVRSVRPPRLYVSADGPRADDGADRERVEVVRRYITANVDWDCEPRFLFRDRNEGCRRAVSGGIDWFFGQEEQGIILEEDTLPGPGFFWFCDTLLHHYRKERRVWHIAGYNHFPGRVEREDYFFSRMPGVWGWATWRDRWRHYDVAMRDIEKHREALSDWYPTRAMGRYWCNMFDRIDSFDTWDYQWTYALAKNRALCIRPSLNLVRNIGFGEDATHTKKMPREIVDNEGNEIGMDGLVHPLSLDPDDEEDIHFFNNRLHKPLLHALKRAIRWMSRS